ncbi:hypothetical protein MUP77_18390 [Candidatus Bathyarchaeota archaeon]|nr:hypothetical protein [Candidatus Bathyarchaeota archaeon]
MATPPQIAWIVPIILPLLIGLVVGVIIKNSLKLMFTLAALIVLLVITGFISITVQDVFDQAMKLLPRIIGTGSGFINVLPYSSVTFLIGIVLGLWKG